jgi:metabolite-proton symporter
MSETGTSPQVEIRRELNRSSSAKAGLPTRILAAGMIGTTIEWYDFFLYGFIAPLIFDRLFFPKLDPTAGTIAVFATFSVGFLARPFGGLLFGHFGDRIGRKSVLLVTLLLMGLSTMAIGLLPSYSSIGITATIALVFLRFLQGFALGGESTAAILMAIESSPSGKRGLSGAIIQAAGPCGVILASLSALLIARLPDDDLLSWGWRVPFVFSSVLIVLGLYLRFSIEESILFKKELATARITNVPALEAIKHCPKPIAIVFFGEMAQTSFYYLTAIFSLSYVTRELGVPRDVVTRAILLANIASLVMMPIYGAWSDRIGRKRLFMAGVIFAAIFMTVVYPLLATRDPTIITLTLVIGAGLIHPLMFASEGSYFPELFPTNVRFSALSIGKQLGTVLGGGLAPLVATSLYAWNGSVVLIVAYYLVLALAGIVALSFAKETTNSTARE